MPKIQADPFDDWETAYDAPDPVGEPPKRNPALNVHAPEYRPAPNYTILPSGNTASPIPSIVTSPQMQILQRPTSTGPTSRSGSANSQRKEEKTMEQRLQDYQTARERIFREEEAARVKAEREKVQKVAVERQPTLPAEGAGFASRRKPPTPQ